MTDQEPLVGAPAAIEQPEGPVTCLNCVHWSSRWDNTPRHGGCSIWGDAKLAQDAAGLERLNGMASPQSDGLTCAKFKLHVPSPMDDLDDNQRAALLQLQQRTGALYANTCKLERMNAKMLRYDGVPDRAICREICQHADALAPKFRPLKSSISNFDEILREGAQWKPFLHEQGILVTDPNPAACLHAFSEVDQALKAQFDWLNEEYFRTHDLVNSAPARYEAKVAEAKARELAEIKEQYDWEFKEALMRYNGLKERLLHTMFFERAKRNELEQQLKSQRRRLENINQRYAEYDFELNFLDDVL